MISYSLSLKEDDLLPMPLQADEKLRPYLIQLNFIDTKILANNKMLYGILSITRMDIEKQRSIYDVLKMIRYKCNLLEEQLKVLEHEANSE
jgi:hypothetical protein